jgi:hypothetical protein
LDWQKLPRALDLRNDGLTLPPAIAFELGGLLAGNLNNSLPGKFR